MKVKPKEVLVNLPVVHLLEDEIDAPRMAAYFNTFIHGKVKMKYEILGNLNDQVACLFYLQRNDEFQQLRDEFMVLIEQSEMRTQHRGEFLKNKEDENEKA